MPTKPKTFRPPGYRESRANDRKRYDQQRGTATERGYDSKWTEFRDWLIKQPEFVMCSMCTGALTNQVDHIERLTGPNDPRKFELENLQGLCRPCHNRKTTRFDGGYGKAPDTSPAARQAMGLMKHKAKQRAEAIRARMGASFR